MTETVSRANAKAASIVIVGTMEMLWRLRNA